MNHLFQSDNWQAIEPSDNDECEALRAQNKNNSIIYLQWNDALFGSVIWLERMVMIIIDDGYSLQITETPLIPWKKCLYEVIASLKNSESNFEPTADELLCIKELPNGWKLSDLYRYCSKSLPEINYEMMRLNWYLDAPTLEDANNCLYIHPALDRPLTGAEWKAIEQTGSVPALARWFKSWVLVLTLPCASHATTEDISGIGESCFDLRPLGTYPQLRIFAYPKPQKTYKLFDYRTAKQFQLLHSER